MLVYTPMKPNVHYLDARSWLIYELCDGITYEQLVAEFGDAVPEGTSDRKIQEMVDKGLEALLQSEIVTQLHAPDRVSPSMSVD